ncbi:Hypothetical Protein FCC1311_042342 [Hondaea fermentalgiana]|uniref:Uncharacterized protein n=1 Tax=Hondaea fermentalgiana TaxID=2315210 RepID=A0A2R5GI99_9STRA|nr:Hypothetical Protein FCC1311_042342 [Hondaea fermentalgiana]|eukprot:GBG28011.1 Hypothetical Protein FCC1311_042342 [Hondaea fermentalgiana]
MAGYGEWCEQDVGVNGCAGPYVCFVNATWNENVSLCTCSLWYGWRGEQCLEFSGPTFFIIISAGLQGLLGVLALVVALDGIVKYVRFIGLQINTQVLTMVFIGAALTMLVGWRAVSIAIASTPQLYVLETVSNNQGRSHTYIFGERSLLSATLCFGTLALLNISLVWVEVALQSSRVTQKTFSGLTSYRRTVYVFEFVLTTGLFALNAKGLTALANRYRPACAMAGYGEWCEQDVGTNGCAAPYVCYVNASWNDGVSLCTCSLWFGWHGEECLELGGPSYYLLASAGVQGIAAFVGLLAAIDACAKSVRHFGVQANVQAVTLLFSMTAQMLLVTWRAIVMAIVLTPQYHNLEATSNSSGRTHALVPYERLFIASFMCFGTLGLLNVSLVWVQVALRSHHVTQKVTSGLTSYRRTVYAFETIFVAGLVGLNVAGMTAAITIFSAPFILFMIVTFTFGANKMSELAAIFKSGPDVLEGDSRGSEHLHSIAMRYKRIVSFVKSTARRIVLFLSLALLSGILYTALTFVGQRSVLFPNAPVHAVVVFNEGIPLFSLAAGLTGLFYVRTNILEAVHRRAPILRERKLRKLARLGKKGAQNAVVPTSMSSEQMALSSEF